MLNLEINDLEELFQDKVVSKYMSELERVNENPIFREYMSAEEDNKKIENSLKTQWKKEGVKEGREKGFEQDSYKSKIEIAKSMLKDNIDIEVISKYTGLNINDIKVL